MSTPDLDRGLNATESDAPDWHEAQAVFATLADGKRVITVQEWPGHWRVSGGYVFNDELSAVEILVDHDGRVAADRELEAKVVLLTEERDHWKGHADEFREKFLGLLPELAKEAERADWAEAELEALDRVAPPQITEELVDWVHRGFTTRYLTDITPEQVRAALAAALEVQP